MPAVPDASSAPRSASAEAASRASVAVRWAVGVGAATMTAIGLVLLFLLTLATNNRALYERNYAWLFRRQRAGGGTAAGRAGVDWSPAALAFAQGALWQPSAGQAGGHLCAGGADAGCADLCGVVPVRHAVD